MTASLLSIYVLTWSPISSCKWLNFFQCAQYFFCSFFLGHNVMFVTADLGLSFFSANLYYISIFFFIMFLKNFLCSFVPFPCWKISINLHQISPSIFYISDLLDSFYFLFYCTVVLKNSGHSISAISMFLLLLMLFIFIVVYYILFLTLSPFP